MTDVDFTHDELQRWIGREVGGKYRVLRLVGRGGMGAVVEAENLALGKRVAIKLIDLESASQPEAVQRFEREARTASAIESSHVVQVFDVGKLEDGRPYLVMELLRGENLGARLHRLGRLPVPDAIHVTVQVLRGLHRAHEQGVVHRDLKPENVFLVETDADPMFAKIVDFGISKVTRRGGLDANTLTQQGVVLGTPFYMAPEQAQSLPDLDGRADLWSLGAILYECLAGHRPFTGDNYEQVIIAICTQPAPRLHDTLDIPSPLADVVSKALERQREDRFSSAREFLEALQAAVPDLVGEMPPSIDATTDGRVLQAGIANAGPRTDRSWSSGRGASPDEPSGLSRKPNVAKLTAFGGVALLAIALVVGLMSRGPSVDPASGLVGSHVQPVASARPVAVRVETNVQGAVVSVDGREVPDAVVRGRAGDSVRVRVRALGFLSEDRTLLLDPERTVMRFDLREEGSAASRASTGPSVVRPPRTSSTTRPSGTGSGSLTGGLELKTDL